ncbi:MAG: ABC transporter substrate-binding protein [Rhodospirillales bacterium]|nr:ABC transporter substrate-binding protein [Rhodospirillales bacterium]
MSKHRAPFAAAALALPLAFAALPADAQQTNLRIFVGGQQRPDVMRKILDLYESRTPGVRVAVEVGGATSDQQQQYLNTVLTSRDAAIDVMLIDVIRPAQFAAAGWAEPLDSYLGSERDAVMARYLPAYREANIVNGKVIALPYFADAQFLYFRTDLLEKYKLQPPKTWEELASAAQTILKGENNPNLRGFSTAGAPIEGTVCTFLVPMWGAGGQFLNAQGKPDVGTAAGKKALQLWTDLKASGVTPANLAEIVTDRIRVDFQSGNLLFAMQWGYAWNRFQNDADSVVKGKTNVVPLPGFAGNQPATCIGGWQIAVSAFSKNKAAAVNLLKFLSSPEVSKMQAILASHLPVFAEVYQDPEVLKVNPWFQFARNVVVTGRSRPVSPDYPEVSEIIRTNINAFLAGTRNADQAIADMNTRLARVYR